MAPPGIQVGWVPSTAVAISPATHASPPPPRLSPAMHPAAMHATTTHAPHHTCPLHRTCPPATHAPPVNRITDACENITLQQLRCGR